MIILQRRKPAEKFSYQWKNQVNLAIKSEQVKKQYMWYLSNDRNINGVMCHWSSFSSWAACEFILQLIIDHNWWEKLNVTAVKSLRRVTFVLFLSTAVYSSLEVQRLCEDCKIKSQLTHETWECGAEGSYDYKFKFQAVFSRRGVTLSWGIWCLILFYCVMCLKCPSRET